MEPIRTGRSVPSIPARARCAISGRAPRLVRLLLLPAAAALGIVAGGCGSNELAAPPADPFEARKLPDAVAADAALVVGGNNRFALDLYARLREAEGNLFASPFSVSTALAMTSAGAAGRTAEEMAAVLHLPEDAAARHRAFGALIASLDTGAGLGGYRLSIANRLWAQAGFPFLETFLATTRDHYRAALGTVDFSRDAEGARGAINAWVEEKTEGRIEDLMPRGSVTADTRLVLANAIYFKGRWAAPFDRDLTHSGPFHVGPGRTVEVPLMRRHGTFRAAWAEGLAVLELPYEGADLSMLVILPDAEDGLPEVEGRLSPEAVDAWIGALRERGLVVTFPRFRVTSAFSLNAILAALGMPSAFDPDAADFSGMDGRRDLVIQAVVHKGFVEVNEEGTEAAAATGVSVGAVSAPLMFIADHPFLFLIRDNVTGSLLFIGRVVDPTR